MLTTYSRWEQFTSLDWSDCLSCKVESKLEDHAL